MGATLSGSANTHLAPAEKRRASLEGTRIAAAKFAKDMKKLTTAAAKLKLKGKTTKIVKSVSSDAILEEGGAKPPAAATRKGQNCHHQQQQQGGAAGCYGVKPEPLPTPIAKRESRPAEYRLSDLCIALGHCVHRQCPQYVAGPTEIVQWLRVADRSLQLNGWTVNSFVCESHIVFTFMLIRKALEMFECKSQWEAKQLFFLCLYISYTYNANEISYPLKPFLIQKDRVAFWEKCIALSMKTTREMLRLNQDHVHYCKVLRELRAYVA